jgi:hypothetical protein
MPETRKRQQASCRNGLGLPRYFARHLRLPQLRTGATLSESPPEDMARPLVGQSDESEAVNLLSVLTQITISGFVLFDVGTNDLAGVYLPVLLVQQDDIFIFLCRVGCG